MIKSRPFSVFDTLIVKESKRKCRVKHVKTDNISDIMKLLCATGYLVGERVGTKRRSKIARREPWYKRRLEGNIQKLKKELSKIAA